jgi:hypothetical protein
LEQMLTPKRKTLVHIVIDCEFFSLRTFVLKREVINRTLPYIYQAMQQDEFTTAYAS